MPFENINPNLFIRFKGIDHEHDSEVDLAEGLTSKAYRQFYQETVQIAATVIRDSFYKKPKLRIQKIELNQPELKLEE